MKIELSKAGKRFNREWIFRNTNLTFRSGSSYAITGPNGSGKSTLLQTIGGMFQLSEGTIKYSINEVDAAPEGIYHLTSLCAPYLDLIEELTLTEFLQFHNRFKTFIHHLSYQEIIQIAGLERSANKQIRNYSSGMKQRVKLVQAIFSNTSIVLLDEPCNNLDTNGIELYHSLINNYCNDRLVIVCSNDTAEYSFCQNIIPMQSLKSNPVQVSQSNNV